MTSLTLGLRRVLNCKKDLFRSSTALYSQKFGVTAAPRDLNDDRNPTPNRHRDIFPSNPDQFPTRRDPDMYPPSPTSPPSPGPKDDLPMPDADPIKRDINPDVNPTDMPGM
jgi:hypothetical protein